MKKYAVFIGIAVLLLGAVAFYRYHGRDVDERGATLLMRSLESRDDLTKTRRFIKRADDINARDKAGRTALFYAARYAAEPQALAHLLQAGADVNASDKQGYTPLMRAAKYNASPEVAEVLVRAGADANAADAQGETALTLAARYNSPAVLKIMLRAGADPDVKTRDGKTAAELLAENERFSEQEKTDYRQAMLVLSILRPVGK